jgi:hypothetical protein
MWPAICSPFHTVPAIYSLNHRYLQLCPQCGLLSSAFSSVWSTICSTVHCLVRYLRPCQRYGFLSVAFSSVWLASVVLSVTFRSAICSLVYSVACYLHCCLQCGLLSTALTTVCLLSAVLPTVWPATLKPCLIFVAGLGKAKDSSPYPSWQSGSQTWPLPLPSHPPHPPRSSGKPRLKASVRT